MTELKKGKPPRYDYSEQSLINGGFPYTSDFIKDIENALLNGDISLKEIMRAHLEQAVNQLLQTELTAVLGYQSYQRTNSTNARNGSYARKIDIEFGPINIQIPRDRLNQFQNALFGPYVRRTDSLETTIVQLYSKGITTREIANLIEKMYGEHYSPTTISNISTNVTKLVEDYHQRRFNHSQYVCVFLDATYIPLKRDTVQREAVNIAIEIRSDGQKEVLDYSIAPTENNETWNELLQGLVERGITDVQLFITDGMVGLQNAIIKNYPQAKFQRCWVHVARNLMGHVRKDDRQQVMHEFKAIHQAENRNQALRRLNEFAQHWQVKYSRAVHQIQQYDDLFTFYDFPSSIRNSIYSTNLIESFNKGLKKRIHQKEQFPNEDSLDRFIVTQVMEYNEKSSMRSHRGFKACQDTLDSMFI